MPNRKTLTPRAALILSAAAIQGRSIADMKRRSGCAASTVSEYLSGRKNSPKLDRFFAAELHIEPATLEGC